MGLRNLNDSQLLETYFHILKSTCDYDPMFIHLLRKEIERRNLKLNLIDVIIGRDS
jgi:hypothetical protein